MKRSVFGRSCCTTPSAMRFWAVVFLLVYGAGLLLGIVWPPMSRYSDTLVLVALGAACVFNYARNRTIHCALTGPVFIVAASIAALNETGVWRVNESALWVVVFVFVAGAFFVEWRTVARARGASRT